MTTVHRAFPNPGLPTATAQTSSATPIIHQPPLGTL